MIKDFLPIKLICIFTLYLFIFPNFRATAQDQERKVQGKVVNEYGMPISGATILLNGTLVGTITDEKGSFLLKLTPGQHTLTVNHLGYHPMVKQFELVDVPINLSIKLIAAGNLMEEVIITGLKSQSAVATRTLLPLLNIPQAITIVGQKTIRQQASTDLAAISKNIVGLNFTGNYSGAGSSQFFNARGFDLNDSQNYRLNGVMVWN